MAAAATEAAETAATREEAAHEAERQDLADRLTKATGGGGAKASARSLMGHPPAAAASLEAEYLS